MCQVAVAIPDAVLYDTHMSYEQADTFVRRCIALAYYTHHGVSLGYCAQIAAMPEEDFLRFLGEQHISVFHFDNQQEFLDELKNA